VSVEADVQQYKDKKFAEEKNESQTQQKGLESLHGYYYYYYYYYSRLIYSDCNSVSVTPGFSDGSSNRTGHLSW